MKRFKFVHTIDMAIDGENQQLAPDSVPFARSYQLDALEKALKGNTIVFLETGSGKTLVAIMLLRSCAHLLRKPSPFIAVFLVPTVVLVTQQGEAISMHTDLKVGKYYGELGVDYWDAATWKHEMDEHEVLVMTPAILHAALSHRFLNIDWIKVLIFDECHNARGNHFYARIMREFYSRGLKENALHLPKIFGMTASPLKAKSSCSATEYWKQIRQLENLMNSKVFTCESESVIAQYIPFSTPKVRIYKHLDVPCVIVECIESDLKRLIEKDVPKTIKNPRHVGGRVEPSRDFKELIKVIHLYVQATEFIILKTTCQGTSLMLGSKAERSWKVLESRSRARSQNEEPCGRMVLKQCDRMQWSETSRR